MQETGFDPWVRKIPWRREWLPTPVFLQENSIDRGARGLQSMGLQRISHDERLTNTFTFKGAVIHRPWYSQQ